MRFPPPCLVSLACLLAFSRLWAIAVCGIVCVSDVLGDVQCSLPANFECEQGWHLWTRSVDTHVHDGTAQGAVRCSILETMWLCYRSSLCVMNSADAAGACFGSPLSTGQDILSILKTNYIRQGLETRSLNVTRFTGITFLIFAYLGVGSIHPVFVHVKL